MKLSERKKKILQCVVDDYILTAQPVSSKSISEKYLKDVSSATVRSELVGLEEMGFLSQPHTSSGRVPSIEAYKFYVSELMDKGKLSAKEIGKIKDAFKEHTDNLEEVALSAVKVISELTDCASVVSSLHDEKEKILKIDIFRNRPNQALLLIMTETSLIRDKFISIPEKMTDLQIEEASKLIGKLLVGKQFGEVIGLDKKIKDEFLGYREIFEGIMRAIEEHIKKDSPKIYLQGQDKILESPEYNDVEKVKNFLSVVTSQDKLADLLKKENDDIEVNIKIGGNDQSELSDFSVVTATYSSGGIKVGTYGVIGPVRMDYQKVVTVLEGVGKVLEDILNNK